MNHKSNKKGILKLIGPDPSSIGNTTYICGANGNPLRKESFGNMFRKACNAAGIKKSAHGIRKLSATRAAEAGATVPELKALFGWTDDEMATFYTMSADRKKLSMQAFEKMKNNDKK